MKHIHFVAIGGAGINPLAKFARLAGFRISGSDLRSNEYIEKLQEEGVAIHITSALSGLKNELANDIDWVVYSSAVSLNEENKEFFEFLDQNNIKHSKRDKFLDFIIKENKQKLIAIAGTHGKTTTTTMVAWLMKNLNLKANYILPAEVEFGDSVNFDKDNEYLIYEADEFDKNFLSFNPYITLISGISWDHQEIYPSVEEYNNAFIKFLNNSNNAYMFERDAEYLNHKADNIVVLSNESEHLNNFTLKGKYNREDAFLAAIAVSQEFNVKIDQCIKILNEFKGLHRRMEEITSNLYTDYAHTPEKIKAAINVAKEMVEESKQRLVVVYEPLTNRRQTYIKHKYADVFMGVDQLYWIPSYLARENPLDKILTPKELIEYMENKNIASPLKISELRQIIDMHLQKGDFILCMSGGGANSLDEWLRENY